MKTILQVVEESIAGINNSLAGTDQPRIPPEYARIIAEKIGEPVTVFKVIWRDEKPLRPLQWIYRDNIGDWRGQMPKNHTGRAVYLANGEAFTSSDELMEKFVRAGEILND